MCVCAHRVLFWQRFRRATASFKDIHVCIRKGAIYIYIYMHLLMYS